MQDRRVRRVVAGADAIDAERDGLSERLAFERARDAAPARRSRARGPLGADDASHWWITEHRDTDDVIPDPRDPKAILVHFGSREPAHVPLQRLRDAGQRGPDAVPRPLRH